MPDHHCYQTMPYCRIFHFSLIFSQIWSVWCQICSFIQLYESKTLKLWRLPSVSILCITPWGHINLFFISSSWFVYFSAWTGFSIITWNDVDSAQVCFSITCYNCWWSVSQEYILHKKMKGEKQYVPLKNTKIQFHTCDWDPSTYHEYDIHKLLTLLYYSTYTILKLVPALRYVFPMMPLYRLQILNKSALQLYKT